MSHEQLLIVAVLAAVYWMASAILHTHQLCVAFIKFVVAHGVVIQTDQVESLDGRLIMEQSRDQRTGPDHVAGRNNHSIWIVQTQVLNMGRQVFYSPGIDRTNPARRAGGWFQIPMKIIDRQDLHTTR